LPLLLLPESSFLPWLLRTKYDALGAAVVAASQGAEALLACCVPHRQLHAFAVNGEEADPKVNSCMYKDAVQLLGPVWVLLGALASPADMAQPAPIVEVVTSSKRSAVNRNSKQLLPTAESPTRRTCSACSCWHAVVAECAGWIHCSYFEQVIICVASHNSYAMQELVYQLARQCTRYRRMCHEQGIGVTQLVARQESVSLLHAKRAHTLTAPSASGDLEAR
jgi:hypothetical protein